MRPRSRVLLATAAGLVLAGIAHLSAVLAIPWMAERDALSRLRGAASGENATLIQGAVRGRDGAGANWLSQPDPAVAVGACAFNLEEGPLRVTLRTDALFQSLSVHARGTGVFYAVTDRAGVRGSLDLVVMTRRQLDDALAADEEEVSRDVRVVAPALEGLVVVRALAGLPSQRAEADEAARAVTCVTETAGE